MSCCLDLIGPLNVLLSPSDWLIKQTSAWSVFWVLDPGQRFIQSRSSLWPHCHSMTVSSPYWQLISTCTASWWLAMKDHVAILTTRIIRKGEIYSSLYDFNKKMKLKLSSIYSSKLCERGYLFFSHFSLPAHLVKALLLKVFVYGCEHHKHCACMSGYCYWWSCLSFPISLSSCLKYKPLSDGYVAVVLPRLSEASVACSHLLTEDEFSKKKADDSTEETIPNKETSRNTKQSTQISES